MAHTVNVNIKIDEDVKKRMERACAEMGLSRSAAFTMFAKKVGREYRIPFEAVSYTHLSRLRLQAGPGVPGDGLSARREGDAGEAAGVYPCLLYTSRCV